MSNSTHRAEVVSVEPEKHPGADLLSVVQVHGYQVVVRSSDWADIRKGIYLPPDSVVDVKRPEFTFLADQAKLDGKARIKAKKLRGVLSFGLLIPAPDDAVLGDDWAERLGVEHYEPEVKQAQGKASLFIGGETAQAPNIYTVKYDLEAGRRYANQIFEPGELVICSEKIHGASSKYLFMNDAMHVSSRTEWKKEYPSYEHVTVESLEPKVGREKAEEIVARLKEKPKQKNAWWQALDATPHLRDFCEANPGIIVHGEIYGAVQDLRYGCKPGEIKFAAFDMMKDGRWLDFEEAYGLALQWNVPWVPLLCDVKGMPYDFDKVCELAEGNSTCPGANHVREGVVVRSLKERNHPRLGRACLKWVGCSYLERSK